MYVLWPLPLLCLCLVSSSCRGTIVVYSCPRSCSARPVESTEGHSNYIEEFVWVQPS